MGKGKIISPAGAAYLELFAGCVIDVYHQPRRGGIPLAQCVSTGIQVEK
jgi:hypothetical protein